MIYITSIHIPFTPKKYLLYITIPIITNENHNSDVQNVPQLACIESRQK